MLRLNAVFGHFDAGFFGHGSLVLALGGHRQFANGRCRCVAVLLLAQVGEDQLARAGNPVRTRLRLMSHSILGAALIHEADQLRRSDGLLDSAVLGTIANIRIITLSREVVLKNAILSARGINLDQLSRSQLLLALSNLLIVDGLDKAHLNRRHHGVLRRLGLLLLARWLNVARARALSLRGRRESAIERI